MTKQRICIVGDGLSGLMTAVVLAKVPGLEVDLIGEKSIKNADKRTTAISETNYKFINQNITSLGQKMFWPSKKIELFYETPKENVNFLNLNEANSNLMYVFENDKIMLIEMDLTGSMSIKELYPDQTFSIFIMPPSISQLRERLRGRGTDSEKRINIRLKRFQEEMEFRERFDYVMINEDLDLAKIELQKTINKLKQGVTSGT